MATNTTGAAGAWSPPAKPTTAAVAWTPGAGVAAAGASAAMPAFATPAGAVATTAPAVVPPAMPGQPAARPYTPYTPIAAVSAEKPPFIAVYGETNTGKSVDLVSFAGNRGLLIAQPGALRVGRTVLGLDIATNVVEVSTMEEVPAWVQYARDNGFTAVGIDDATLLMKRSAALALERFSTYNAKTGKSGIDFAMYSHLAKIVTDVSTAARWCNLPCLMTFHVQGASENDDGEKFPMGPDLSWRKLVRHVPHESDITILSQPLPMGAKAWDTRANCDKRTVDKILVGDRFDVAAPVSGPLNTAELVRAAGYPLPRPTGLEWMESYVENLAQAILASGEEEKAWEPFRAALAQAGVIPPHVRWVRRDGTHRARIRRYQSAVAMGDT